MKNIILNLLMLISCAQAFTLQGGALAELEKVGRKLLPGNTDQKKIFTTDIENKQEELARFAELKAKEEKKAQDELVELNNDLEETRSKIMITQDQLRKDSENEQLKKKLAALNEEYHLLKELQSEQHLNILEQIIKQINDYLADPEFAKFKQNITEGKKGSSFDDLQDIHQRILELDKRIESLNEQERNANTELENRRRSALANVMAYEKKKTEMDLARKEGMQDLVYGGMSDELIALQEKLFVIKRRVDELKLKEIEYKIELTKIKLFVLKAQRNELRDLFRDMKSSVQVTEADVAFVKDELEKKKQNAYREKSGYDYEIEKVNLELKSHQHELEVLSKRYNISIDAELEKWAKEPKQSVISYTGLCEVGAENDWVLFLARRKDFLKSLVDQIDEKTRHEEVLIAIKESFHKIRYEKFTAQELNQELKTYDMLKAGIKASVSSYNERKTAATDLLETQKKALENIESLRTSVYANKDVIFKDQPKEYNHCLMVLNDAREKIKAQIGFISTSLSVYTDIISLLNSSNKQIDFIVSELGSITIWHRPQYAISWEGLMSLWPDAQQYVADLGTYITHLDMMTIFIRFKSLFRNPFATLIALLKCMFVGGLIFAARAFMPRLISYTHIFEQLHPVVHIPCMLLIALARFFLLYFNSVALWLLIGVAFKFQLITDPYLFSMFYLMSIAYLLYIANHLIDYLAEFNRNHGYLFVSRDFEFRFVLVVSGLVYATIILYMFRKAFMLGNYSRSELPSILLAVNFIILQIALIALIAKEQVLSLIPRLGFGEWIYAQVDRFYYFLLSIMITIIIMSNPYVGFGRLVLYLIRKIVSTTLLVIFLVWLHNMGKRFCAYFFFIAEDDEAPQERFNNAKTWYGFTVIALFVLFVFIGALFAAKIWNWPEQLARISHVYDIVEWLKQPFSHVDQKPVSVWLFLQLITFILGGIAISFAFNHLVIGKIFDILLIEPGVQNTVSSITYYLFFALSVIIGFSAVGLSSLLYILLALVVGIGWIIKDPVSDFVAYFIILVQRPVKVGDLVTIDQNGPAVVRRVTPRSVILRRRNSTTLIMPNSAVINTVITNWNYARDFIAFEDIIITISYQSDALVAQKIFLQVLTESPYVLKNPKPIVRLDNFTENGYLFMVRGFLSSNYTLDQWDIASEIRLAIIRRLKDAGIVIAVPVREMVSRSHHER